MIEAPSNLGVYSLKTKAVTNDLAMARERLAHYQAAAPYVRHDGKSFGWAEEIAFWQSEVNLIAAGKGTP